MKITDIGFLANPMKRDSKRQKPECNKQKSIELGFKLKQWRINYPLEAKKKNARQSNPGMPESIIEVIALKNLIKSEIRNQTNTQ